VDNQINRKEENGKIFFGRILNLLQFAVLLNFKEMTEIPVFKI
jgi:hypothetical protein